jgi:hypothetical protein
MHYMTPSGRYRPFRSAWINLDYVIRKYNKNDLRLYSSFNKGAPSNAKAIKHVTTRTLSLSNVNL